MLPPWFRRKKPAPPSKTTAPVAPRLDELRAELAALISDADQRVDRMLERLRARESKEGTR